MLPELQGPGDEIEDRALNVYTRSEILSDAWQYIALGDYHVYQQVGPNAYYSGSIEYTSLNPWADVREVKRALTTKELESRSRGVLARCGEVDGSKQEKTRPRSFAARALSDPVRHGKRIQHYSSVRS